MEFNDKDIKNLPIDPTAARHNANFKVDAPHVLYDDAGIHTTYTQTTSTVKQTNDGVKVTPHTNTWKFDTSNKPKKTGLMMIGIGGNNGTTLVATILANRHNISWHTKTGVQSPNYIGSLTMASTVRVGVDENGKDVNLPWGEILPLVHPNDLVLGGWDISSAPLDEAMRRASVLDWDLQRQVAPYMKDFKPLPSIYYPEYIATNQSARADNVLNKDQYPNKKAHLEKVREDIRHFKAENDLDTVVVCWTANTERFSSIVEGKNDTADNLLKSVEENYEEISPSTIFALASILEDAPFVNGAPQNTLIPAVIEFAERQGAFLGGDDLKTGQTKVKSVLAEYLVNAGLKPLSIASYNHLGNNDGHNLSEDPQFKSKEISKRSVVDDMVDANGLLYQKGEHPDHIVVIKYLPAVGDDKRAIDEYNSEIMMGGRNVVSIFNVCEDSLLATPLLLDLTIWTELFTRVKVTPPGKTDGQRMHSVLSLLSYMLKAPLTKPGHEVVNALGRQRGSLEAFVLALVGLNSFNLNLDAIV
ncbi:putative myo-inositol 1-phosphate synthase [Wallemia mellicola]|uniref:Inositol-3-phosphate synthase n=1 Tax=Wallemia mellicola TaxID=1708541 RepID=A0AB74KG86_9BASI|nr:putative myo-inositol 1-phosphate synthase [Wallemia mellicola]TIC69607.1 putative myo-inositol 1-phosphate synthase [Wallemia mellicola]